jgi:hypothetical protein
MVASLTPLALHILAWAQSQKRPMNTFLLSVSPFFLSVQRRASQARAKRLRSVLTDTDSRQRRREARELKARGRAQEFMQARIQ